MVEIFHKNSKLFIYTMIIISLLIIFFTVNFSIMAQNLAISQTAILKDDLNHVTIEPRVIVNDSTGGFLVAGTISASKQGWASKVDKEGKVLWMYHFDLKDKMLFGQGAEFRGAVSMPDGSSYLCGSMPKPPLTYPPALLVHLDGDGRALSEKLMIPAERPSGGVARFLQCSRWGNDIVIIGNVFHSIKQLVPSNIFIDEIFHWVVLLNSNDEIVWEKLIPADPGVFDVQSLTILSDSDMVFSSFGNMGKTAVIRVSKNGNVLRQDIAGLLQLVHPVLDDGITQLFGQTADKASVLITLDDQLKETRRIKGSHPSDFVTYLAYRRPDRSLVLFGSAIRNGGASFLSRVAAVDPELKGERTVDLRHEPYFDTGFVKVAVPIGNGDTFVAATSFMKHGPDDEARIGAALDFIQLK